MKWSWKIGQVAGIGIYLHVTFLILIVWLAVSFFVSGAREGTREGLIAALSGVGFILAVFFCVVLHELGHALSAKRFGIRTRDITLLPIGGLARLERMPDVPWQELVVALAGPAVNVVIAIVLGGISTLLDRLQMNFSQSLIEWGFWPRLVLVNVILVLFNLLPAFPMDGGRALRALLAMRIDYVRATQVAAGVGQMMAVLFALVGLLVPNPWLLFIALFVYIGAAQESAIAEVHAALGGIPVRHAMLTDFRVLSANDRFSDAVAHLLEGSQQDFPIMDGDQVVGVLLRRDLLTGLSSQGPDGLVRDAMKTQCGTIEDREMLESVFRRMQSGECSAVPVIRDGHLVGMITLENIGEFMMVQSALRKLRQLEKKA